MHILLLPSSYAPKVGGLETAVAQLGAELVRRGHQVTVVTNRYPRALPAYERVGDIAVHRLLMPNVWPTWGQVGRMAKYMLGLALAPLQAARLALLFRALKPDVVNMHYLGVPACYARVAGLLAGRRPLVVSTHGSDLVARPLPSGSPALSRYIVSGAQAATAPSANQAELLRQFMGADWATPVTITGNGVMIGELANKKAYKHPRPYVFAAARFTPVKGLDVLLRALKLLVDGGCDVDLILAGAGPEEVLLRALVRELGLEQRVLFWGIANRLELAALLHGCAVYALPSRAESFGIAALEAMACGRPVVASRCGGIPEVVQDGITGVLIPPDDPAALSAAICALLGDEMRRNAMGWRGYDLALSQWSWGAVAERYERAYGLARK